MMRTLLNPWTLLLLCGIPEPYFQSRVVSLSIHQMYHILGVVEKHLDVNLPPWRHWLDCNFKYIVCMITHWATRSWHWLILHAVMVTCWSFWKCGVCWWYSHIYTLALQLLIDRHIVLTIVVNLESMGFCDTFWTPFNYIHSSRASRVETGSLLMRWWVCSETLLLFDGIFMSNVRASFWFVQHVFNESWMWQLLIPALLWYHGV